MTPEEQKEVLEFVRAMKAAATIPLETDRALRDRLGLSGIPLGAVSSKNADSEDQAVDEGGAATYSVMGDPVGFLEITLGTTTYYVPYFNV